MVWFYCLSLSIYGRLTYISVSHKGVTTIKTITCNLLRVHNNRINYWNVAEFIWTNQASRERGQSSVGGTHWYNYVVTLSYVVCDNRPIGFSYRDSDITISFSRAMIWHAHATPTPSSLVVRQWCLSNLFIQGHNPRVFVFWGAISERRRNVVSVIGRQLCVYLL